MSLITAVPKHELLRQQGVAHPIDYRTQDFEAEVERIAGRRGIDVVLDPLAGAATQKNYRLLRTAAASSCLASRAPSKAGAAHYEHCRKSGPCRNSIPCA